MLMISQHKTSSLSFRAAKTKQQTSHLCLCHYTETEHVVFISWSWECRIICACTYFSHVTHWDKGREVSRLSSPGHFSRLPRPLCVECILRDEANETLIVVPVSNDVHGTGHHNHPRYRLVKREVLVKQTLYLTRRTLDGWRWQGGRWEEFRGKKKNKWNVK